MSACRISAVVCAALAVTFASGSAALAYSTDSAKPPSTTDDSCAAGPTVLRGTNGDDNTGDKILDARDKPLVTTICAFGGNDIIYANDNGDTIYAGPGNDTIYGGNGDDTIEAQGGDDKIFGGGGIDNILGQTGKDTIYVNTLTEGDFTSDDQAMDTIDGGTGQNTCYYTHTGPTADTATNC
jgi:Ca2+-binding RTX toxin-like protein